MCICPLTSLMMDQHSKLASRGLKTEFVGETQKNQDVSRKVLRGEVQLVYITPENLIQNVMYREMLLSQR